MEGKYIMEDYLSVEEQFKKTLNNVEISKIRDPELREIRMRHWKYRTKIFRDETRISDQEFNRLTDNDYEEEQKELEAYRKRKGI